MELKKQDVPKGGFKAKKTLIVGIAALILLFRYRFFGFVNQIILRKQVLKN